MVNYYSLKAQYKIKIEANQPSNFYVRIDQTTLTQRIFEGLPTYFNIEQGQSTTVEFTNSKSLSKNLTVMIDVSGDSAKNADLQFIISLFF